MLGVSKIMKNAKEIALVLLTVGVIAFIQFLDKGVIQVEAQDRSNLSELLEELDNRGREQPGFTFSIAFASSPGTSITQAQIRGEDGFIISDIGADYVCIDRVAGAALTVGCIPFSNIASISFLDN
jgi:hypothetical protein